MSDKTPAPPKAPGPKKPGFWAQFLNALGNAIGNDRFGGGR